MNFENVELKTCCKKFARGERSERVLKLIFKENSLEKIYHILTKSEFGQFVETFRKEFAKRELGLKLYDKFGNVVQSIEGVGSHDKGLDLRGVDEENNKFYAETHKMKKGIDGPGLSADESGFARAAWGTSTFVDQYLEGGFENYEVQFGLASFNGFSREGLKEVKENAEYDVKVMEYDDLVRQFERLCAIFENCDFDVTKDNIEKPTPWPHQADLKNKCRKGPNTGGFGSGSIRNQNFQVLLYHDCRTGKTYASLFMIEEFIGVKGEYPNILLLGPPSLFGDWIQSVEDILQDQPTNIVEINDGKQGVLNQIQEDCVNFILSSFEMLKIGDENKRALQELRKVEVDFCFTDECHQQVRTRKTREQLKQLNQGNGVGVYSNSSGCRWVALSATPHRKILVDRFGQDEIHTFGHFQKEAKIESDDLTEYDDHPLLKNKILTIDQPEIVDFYDERSGLNLDLLAQDPKRLRTLVEVIYKLVYNIKHECRKTGEMVMVKDGIWRVSKQEIAEEMAECARNVFSGTANIKVVHSEEYDAEKSINEAEALFNRIDATHNILIVVGQLTEGHTFETVDHTVDLTEFKSHIEVFQFMKRAGTSYQYEDREKGTYFSFDFSVYRTLRVIYEAITAHEEYNQDSDLDREDMLGLTNISQMVPVNDVGRYSIVDWDNEEIREQFNNVPSIAKEIRAKLSDIQNLFDENSSVLDGASYESDNGEIEFKVDKGNGSRGGQNLQKTKQSSGSGINGGGGSNGKNVDFEMLKTVWSNLPMLVLLAWADGGSEVKYEVPGLVRELDEKYMEEVLGELGGAFSDVGIEFNPDNVASAISEVLREDKIDVQKEAVRNLENEVKNHIDNLDLLFYEWGSNTYTRESYADIGTPENIVKNTNSQLPKEFWKNPANIYFDPCCGKGTFLLDAFKRFSAGLKGKFRSEEERKRHIIENQLYGADIQYKNKTLTEKQICGDSEYDHNIEQANSLKKDWNVEFDAVVTNPPYNEKKERTNNTSTIYPKFIKRCEELSEKYVCAVIPARWFDAPLMKKFRGYMSSIGLESLSYIDDDFYFDGTHIEGGVSFFLADTEKSGGKVNYNSNDQSRTIETDGSDIILKNATDDTYSIIEKVNCYKQPYPKKHERNSYINTTGEIDATGKYWKDSGDIKVYGSKDRVKFIHEDDLDPKLSYGDWKVYTAYAYGGDGAFGTTFIGRPEEIATSSYIYFPFDTKEKAVRFRKYMSTKFFRYLFLLRKSSQNISADGFKWIPELPDSLENINDRELYDYFDLSDEEILEINRFINSQ